MEVYGSKKPGWRITTRASGWAGRTRRLGRDGLNHTIGMMRPSSAVTDSNYVGLTDPGALRSGG